MNWFAILAILGAGFAAVCSRNLAEDMAVGKLKASQPLSEHLLPISSKHEDQLQNASIEESDNEHVQKEEPNSKIPPKTSQTENETLHSPPHQHHPILFHLLLEPDSELIPSAISGILEGDIFADGGGNDTFYNVTEVFDPEDENNTKIVSRKKRIIPIMFARIEKNHHRNGSVDQCIGNPEDEFPEGLFTPEQRKKGALIVSILVGIYCFTLLALVCNDYFLPSVECICESLNLSPDVAAATFMSIATSAPELFVNIIGTFVTHSDIGIGTVVGSSMFNCLGVAAVGGLACSTKKFNYIQIDWWPLTRDCIIYVMSIALLVIIIWDGKVMWYEGLLMFVMYFVYFIVMFNNRRIYKSVQGFINKRRKDVAPKSEKQSNEIIESKPPILVSTISSSNNNTVIDGGDEITKRYVEYNTKEDEVRDGENDEGEGCSKSLFQLPGHWAKKIFFIYSWPIKLCLSCTIPDCKRYPKIFPLTFVVCILWIGFNSYMVSWMITIIGNTLSIPAAVLGLTFLAAGGCLPEAISIVIMSRRGEGSMGVSNSLGANTMNILLSLGMPWFLKTVTMGAKKHSYIEIQSANIQYTILALILVAFLLYITLYLKKFRLSRSTGGILMAIYLAFLLAAILLETIFRGELEVC